MHQRRLQVPATGADAAIIALLSRHRFGKDVNGIKRNPMDFQKYLEEREDAILAKVLVVLKLVDQKTLHDTYKEIQQSSQEESCKLGQMLLRKRLLSINDYTKAMTIVRQQAQILYQKTIESQEAQTARLERKIPPEILAAQNPTQTTKAEIDPIKEKKLPEKPASSPKNAMRFGSYEVIEEIARGGMGIVYKARQLHLNRIVALKVLLAGGAASETEIQRFRREAEAAGSLQHPNIVSIYEIGEENKHHYFTMDFIEGPTLQQLIKKKTRRKLLLQILEKVARAMAHAHQRGIVHRDIKPSNIIVSSENEPKITDFGLAKKLDTNTMLTESGATLGTPYYMAPEQTQGLKDIDGRADIYSMGVMLYEILTNRLPFNAGTLVELYHKIVEEEPVLPSRLNRKVDKEIELVCLKAMEKEPGRRYQTASELADDLNRYLNGESVSARRANPVYRFVRKAHKNKHFLLVTGCISLLVALMLLFFILQINEKSLQQKQLLQANALIEESKMQSSMMAQLEKIEKAIQIAPYHVPAYLAKGEIYLKNNQYPNAIMEYSRILVFNPKSAEAYYGRGEAYLQLKDWEKAIKEFSLAIQNKEKFIEAYMGRANARGYRKDGNEDFSLAIEDHEKADSLKKEAITEAEKYLQKGNYKSAMEKYERVLAADPKHALSHYGKALVFIAQKNWQEAQRSLQQAINAEADFPELYQKMAFVYEKLGKPQEAKMYQKKASEK